MNKELEKKFVERWPEWFDVNGSIQHTLMPHGFCCGDGWFDILWDLCLDIEKILYGNLSEDERKILQVTRRLDRQKKEFEVIQVKEKFGGLRFYYEGSGCNEEIRKRVSEAEQRADTTCEECGKDGKLTGKNWLRTLCENCEKERNRK